MIAEPQTVERLGRTILERDTQTRIGCFLIGVKEANAAVLARVEVQPMPWEAYALLHGQLCRELELIGLLLRVTEWSRSPLVYAGACWATVGYLRELQFTRFLAKPFAIDPSFYRYLGLSHALYSQLRFIRALPLELSLEHPFLAFLRTLETLHGRELQAQIALLRNLPVKLDEQEKEKLLGAESERVKTVFRKLLVDLTEEPLPAAGRRPRRPRPG